LIGTIAGSGRFRGLKRSDSQLSAFSLDSLLMNA